MANGVLALLGSGETAPGMTKIHRGLLKALGEVRAVNLDTSYGFQENVPQMTAKLLDYFSSSLHVEMKPLHLTSFEGSTALERELFRQGVRTANYVFSGPGSPSYALAQWRPLGLAGDLASVLDDGGTLCFASAAALTLGAYTAPIYEIYKAGSTLYWLEGLNILAPFGLNCVIIPHYDNQEGGNYDTSRCYLGERRLAVLEEELPDDVAILGVDEHTALILDLEDRVLRVLGRSHGYWRVHGTTTVLTNGSTVDLNDLKSVQPARVSQPVDDTQPPPTVPAPETDAVSESQQLGQLVSEGGPDALGALAQLVQLAGRGNSSHVDPAPLVASVLAVRDACRSAGQYDLADQLRDALLGAGVVVQDGPRSSTWSIVPSA
jgi:hypothetical protein